MKEFWSTTYCGRIVPAVKIENLSDAVPIAESLYTGGIEVMEVTFRTDVAAQAIAAISKSVPDIIVGAGTILSIEQLNRAIDNGARFIVSPGVNPTIVKAALDKHCAVIPGVATPTEIEVALSFDLKVVKFFPSELLGGVRMINALAGPYNCIKFMPSGGINEGNMCEYLSNVNVFAVSGSWLTPQKLIQSRDYKGITTLAIETVRAVKQQVK
ncbi:MAG: bifunctional 4-hydroxy-2-oxoglutarate aldolase/2-dehydro-3-deoxy-phosphogluconate aldolase [Christensenellales bacterium]|jgi:2-dehydro-3-deoxyphosphogluconate aldolase/(4S)-4-hydroxy-2-oxoglutarate aldolase